MSNKKTVRRQVPADGKPIALPRAQHGGIWRPGPHEPLEHWLERLGAPRGSTITKEWNVVVITRCCQRVGEIGLLKHQDGHPIYDGVVASFLVLHEDVEDVLTAANYWDFRRSEGLRIGYRQTDGTLGDHPVQKDG